LATIDIGSMAVAAIRTTALATAVAAAINSQLVAAGVTKSVAASFTTDGLTTAAASSLLRISATTAGDDVLIQPASTDDLAAGLMLGTSQGGIEVGAYAARRPAPNGISLDATDDAVLATLRDILQGGGSAITGVILDTLINDGTFSTQTVAVDLQTTGPTDPLWKGSSSAVNGFSDGLREKLGIIAAAVNAAAAISPPSPLFPWTATVSGHRLTLRPTGAVAADNLEPNWPANNFTVGTDVEAQFAANVAAYSLGAQGMNLGEQTTVSVGDDGAPALPSDYDTAYAIADREVDLFNLLVLTPDAGVPVTSLYANASVFCQKRRAVLLMDPPPAWTDVQDAIDVTTGVPSLRTGLVNDYAALFFPRVTIVGDDGLARQVGPAGAIAGLMARIDGTRGVWKAPAGTEAGLRGIVGVEHRFSDDEQGMLNPRAINTIRVFPEGLVNFGARTMDGDDGFGSEYKYIPIRRLALFIEESLYRGLKWVVFEPNDEPLWGQVRLNVGSFMHDLFRKGAFQGAKQDAYFVKCDSETTTQSDRDLGLVNIQVGFAPLKPAEFVILYLQQIAGQIQT
jgi:uncharacterized protein